MNNKRNKIGATKVVKIGILYRIVGGRWDLDRKIRSWIVKSFIFSNLKQKTH